MRIAASRDYDRMNSKTYWTKIAKEAPSTGKSERLLWLLDSAKIQYVSSLGGEVEFDEILSNTTEYEAKAATAGLKLNRFQLDDHDGGGVQLAAHWARQMGAYGAYWPQKQISAAIKANGTGYDGVAFFSGAHPVNPFDSAAGSYSNNFTAGSGAGAVPIDSSVTLDVAFNNLAKAAAYVGANYKMPNGEDPRNLRISGLMVPTALMPRAQQLTDAKFLAAAAASGGGSADTAQVLQKVGIGELIEAPELGAAFGGSDTSYYLTFEGMTSDDVGALTYVNREAFAIVYNGEMTDAQLARANELQWLTRGRNVVGYGHPYLMVKCNAA